MSARSVAPLAASITEDGGKPLLTAGGFPWGFVVITLLFVVVFFLYRSMKHHLGKVPDSFDPPAGQPPSGDGERPEP